MKSFQFSLARMRSYKEQVLEKEKTTLRQLQAEKAKIEVDIENLENHRKAREQEFKESKNGLMASDLMLYKFHSENTRLQLNNLYEELRRAEARIEAQIMQAAEKKVKVIRQAPKVVKKPTIDLAAIADMEDEDDG